MPNSATRNVESRDGPRKILRKPSGLEEPDQTPNSGQNKIGGRSETVGNSLLPPLCLIGAAIFAAIASSVMSMMLSESQPSTGASFQIQHNYSQTALSAVLFFELILCVDNVQLARVLICPLLAKFIGVIGHSLLANGYAPLLQAADGRTLNLTLCLLWASTSPIIIFLYSKVTRNSATTAQLFMPTSALGSLVLILSLMASFFVGYRSIFVLMFAIGIWGCFMYSMFHIVIGTVLETKCVLKSSLNVNILFLLSWACVPTVALCGAFGLFSYRSEEAWHGIMDFSLKICLSCLLLQQKVTEEVSSSKTVVKKKASFSDGQADYETEGSQCDSKIYAPTSQIHENGSMLNDSGSGTKHALDAEKKRASFPNASLLSESERDGGGGDAPLLRLHSVSNAAGLSIAGPGGRGGDGGGLGEGTSLPMSGSRKNLMDFVGHKLPEELQHYSQISGGKLEVLSVDDDPINQVRRSCGDAQ
jgi:hypothetical protein